MYKKIFVTGILSLCVTLAFVIAMVSCTQEEQSSTSKSSDAEFLVGVLAPLTGDVADYGNRGKNGAQMAASEINTDGGIKGKKIRLIIEDD